MKEIPVEKIDFGNDTFKVFLRPPTRYPLSQMQLQRIFEALRNPQAKIIYVPDGVEFVIIRKDGTAQVV